MNIEYAILTLKEAGENIDSLISKIERDGNLEELDGNHYALVQQLYWNVNQVWNARSIAQEEIDNCSQDQDDEWCDFPKDLEL